jgi:integral membrane protein
MSSLWILRATSWLESGSLLLLLGVAMPLKHWFGWPQAVRAVGSLHGLLFLVFATSLLRVSLERRWSGRRACQLLLLSVLPGGAIWIERVLTREKP